MTGRRPRALAALALAAAALAAAPAAAQEQARLRAGEHDGYSRIALDVPRLEDWRLEVEGRRAEIFFPGRALAFDTSAILPDRKVTRVTRARTRRGEAGTRLILTLSCPCAAEGFEFRPGMLVIDIRARPPEAPPAPPRKTAAAGPAPHPLPAGPLRVPAATPPPDAAAGPRPDGDPAEADISVDAAQERLLEQLSRAADQGLVEFRSPPEGASATPPDTSRAPDQAPPRDARRSAPPAPRQAPAPLAAPPPAQLEARTAFDAGDGPASDPAPRTCPVDERLAPGLWRRPADPYAALAALRRRLVGEFDRPSEGAALDLARLRTALGFGVEARQTLAAFAPGHEAAELLRDLAHVVDGEAPPADGPLARAGACGGRVGLWRLAAGFAPPDGVLEDPDWTASLLAAFEELPVPMRRLLGPPLVSRLTTLGALDMAEAARLRLDRAPGDHGGAWRLALGRLALARGEAARGRALLREVIESDGPQAPEAMLALADSLLSQDGALPADLVEDIAHAAFARRGTQLGRRLLVAEILGRAGRRRLGAALEVIATELAAGGPRQADLSAALRRILEDARADAVGHMAYAFAVMTHRGLLGEGPAYDEARASVARQLAEAGLANAAWDLLQPALARQPPPVRLAAAGVEIALDRPADALARLEDAEGRPAAELRARAFAAQGRHDRAWAALSPHLPVGAPERGELAWRAREWAAARDSLPEDDPRRLFAAWMAGRGPDAPPPGPGWAEAPFLAPVESPERPSLAGARAAIERARAARARVSEALDDG